MKILYVEDDRCDADSIVRQIKKAGPHFKLDIVSTQKDAIAQLKEKGQSALITDSREPSDQSQLVSYYDMILTKLRLPDGDGLSLLNYIRKHSFSVAVVVIMDMIDETTIMSVLKADADDYLVKSTDYIKRLPYILEDVLNRYRAKVERRPRPRWVLYVVQDDGDVVSISDYLHNHAPYIQLKVVRTGKEALLCLPRQKQTSDFDVLLIDYSSIGFNTMETIKEIRQLRGLDVPIVLLVDQCDESVGIQAIKLGATSYIIKNPTYLVQLLSELDNAYYRVELIRENIALQKAQSDLAHMNRVMAMGELAASIAHEVNQPLCSLITNANTCLRWISAEQANQQRIQAAMEDVVKDGRRASEIIKGIREFLKKRPIQKVVLDINEVIQEVVKLTRAEIDRTHVRLRLNLASNLPVVLADKIQLEQVMLNLITNSIEAMNGININSRYLTIKSGRYDGSMIYVGVRDSGVGLAPQDIKRVFNTFYTTKPEGMGMGLAINRLIIEAHGGWLWASSNEKQGAKFEFTLPTH